jgi:hypothetical protein
MASHRLINRWFRTLSAENFSEKGSKEDRGLCQEGGLLPIKPEISRGTPPAKIDPKRGLRQLGWHLVGWHSQCPTAVRLSMQAQVLPSRVTFRVQLLRFSGQGCKKALPPGHVIIHHFLAGPGMPLLPPHGSSAHAPPQAAVRTTAHFVVVLVPPSQSGNAAVFQQIELPCALPQQVLNELVVLSVNPGIPAERMQTW